MTVWGCVATLTALVKNYVGLVIVRFFLGFVEAPFYPGALYVLSLFYTRKEIATRVSILYAGNSHPSVNRLLLLTYSREYLRCILCWPDRSCHLRYLG
jgi:MFS family permease